MKKYLPFILLCFVCSCKEDLTDDFSFLEGSWKMETSDSSYLLESWEKVSDIKYTALNYFISDTGMQLTEEIEIDITDSGTYYRPTIEMMGEGRQFAYLFVSQKDDKYVFLNEDYDFPQKICYKKIDDENILASIEDLKGEKKKFLHLKKCKQNHDKKNNG